MMRHFYRCSLVLVLLGMVVAPVAAQSEPGYFPVEDLGILDPGKLDVDVQLQGSTIQIAIGAMQDQDPQLKELVSSLTRVRVQVGNVEELDPQIVADRLGSAVAQLEAQGWVRVVSVESESERIYIFSIDGADGKIAGLTALVSEGAEEAVVANLTGSIDPVLLGSMMSRLGDLDLDQFMGGGADDG